MTLTNQFLTIRIASEEIFCQTSLIGELLYYTYTFCFSYILFYLCGSNLDPDPQHWLKDVDYDKESTVAL